MSAGATEPGKGRTSTLNEQPEEEWMSTVTLTHYVINAAITGLCLGAVAALIALLGAK